MTTSSEAIVVAGVRENFKFLVLEVTKLLEDAQRQLADPRDDLLDKIGPRVDYIDNLESMIENKCFRLLTSEELDVGTVDLIRAINTSSTTLERIADFGVNIVGQIRFIENLELLHRFDPEPFFAEIFTAMAVIEDALFRRDMSLALKICRTELELDELYDKVFRRIMNDLRAGDSPEDLVTTLFIYRYLERAGDSLLDIGEAAIFATIGEKLRVSEFQALEGTLTSAEVDHDIDLRDVEHRGTWETRSGSRVARLQVRGEGGRPVVFKEGRTIKVIEEKQALELWDQLEPGLPPRIFAFHDHGEKASILLEYLQGETLQRIILDADARVCSSALALVIETMARVWRRTLDDVRSSPNFMRQLASRLPDVIRVHPEFMRPPTRIGEAVILSFEELLERARMLDEELSVPFTVLIHGDFNTDNLIINLDQRRVHLIDLHRSRPFDYLQDVSVFIVSNFRIKIFDPAPRRRLDQASRELFRFAREFGERHGDTSFDARLALGLARSLMTSTRFDMDPRFSGMMMQRARYLLERLLEHRVDVAAGSTTWQAFHLDESVLVP